MSESDSVQLEVTSTTFPFNELDLEREVLSSGGHAKVSPDDWNISTTKWSYKCVYCELSGINSEYVLVHERLHHPGLPRGIIVLLE